MRKKKTCQQNKLIELLTELERVASNNDLKYNLAYGTALGAVREQGLIEWDTDIDIMVTIDKYENFCDVLEAEMKEEFYLYSREKNKNFPQLFNRIGFKHISPGKLHIDIFPMVGAPKSKVGKYMFGKVSYLISLVNAVKKVKIKEKGKTLSKKGIITISFGKVIFLLVPNKSLQYLYDKLKKAFPIDESDTVYSILGPNTITGFIPKNWIKKSEYKKFEELEYPIPKEWDKYLTRIYGDYMIPKKKNYYQ